MTQKFNFFFNEFVNNLDLSQINNNDQNIVLNGIFLTKIKNTKIKFKTLFNYLNYNNIDQIIKEKKKFDDLIRLNFPDLIYRDLNKYFKIDKSISYAIERLFFHQNNSIFDLNLFYSQNFDKLKDSEINIYYGGEYRLTETFFFLYFLSFIINSNAKKVTFIINNRNETLKKFNKTEDFFNQFLVSETLVNKNFNLNYKNCKNILFTEGLREKNFWIEKLNPLKISYKENFKENFISFKHSSKLTMDELDLYKNFLFKNNLNEKNIKDKDFIFNSLSNYFSNFLMRIIAKRFQDITGFCNKKFNFDKFENLIIPACPLLEIIPIVNEMKIRNKNIYLVPHSSTPSFEYHPDTYKNQITFISPKKIMPSSNWHEENNHKILIISRTFFNSLSKVKKRNRNYFSNLKNYNIFINIRFIVRKILILFLNKIEYLAQIYLLNYFLKPSSNVGLVLNVEIYENLVDLDYDKQNDIILELFDLCIKKELNLIIRRKPGWTNYFFLKKKLSDKFLKNRLKSLILLQDEFAINDFFKRVNVSIFFQGTTAIYESIKNRTPCIFLIDPKLFLLNEQYVEFPEDIVPKLSITEINNVVLDKIYLKNLLDKQLEFIKNEEEVNLRKINNFTELNI